eukprot:12593555-Heterocapsa_arctica.AAC.1
MHAHNVACTGPTNASQSLQPICPWMRPRSRPRPQQLTRVPARCPLQPTRIVASPSARKNKWRERETERDKDREREGRGREGERERERGGWWQGKGR